MKKNKNMFISLGLEKDTTSGELQLCVQFDNNAPNFTKEKDITYWHPTFEEWDFVREAFDLIWKGQGQKTVNKHVNFEQNQNFDDGFESEQPPTENPTENEDGLVDKLLEKDKKT